jgi:putative transposase
VEVLGYCLMTNHVHLVALPHRPDSLAKLMREVQTRYSQYRHALDRSHGHLWQGRYYSCPVEPERLASVMRYVELNPVRAGLATDAPSYSWSSAAVHLGGQDQWNLVSLTDWRKCWTAEQWQTELSSSDQQDAGIREATYTGRPLGPAEFIERLEAYSKRSLKRGLPGRPRNKVPEETQQLRFPLEA